MNRLEELNELFMESSLSEIFNVKREDYNSKDDFSALRFSTNRYRIRSIEIWGNSNRAEFFRIYHAPNISSEIKAAIDLIPGMFNSIKYASDFRDNFSTICRNIYDILSNDSIIEIANNNSIYTKNRAYEGLELPDVDVSDIEVLGRTFNWKEIIAISEDTSEQNELKKVLSQSGVYLQRSKDGKSRYVGSAYSEGGILSRWLKHLDNNGDAKHLKLFILENGYSDIIFTVLEFTESSKSTAAEKRWKDTLGSKNNGQYDALRLNSN